MPFSTQDIVRSVTENVTGAFADSFVIVRGQTPGDIQVNAGAIEQTALTANEPNSVRFINVSVTPTRTVSFRASAAIRVVSANGRVGDTSWGFMWPEDSFAVAIVAIVWLIKTGDTTWEIRSRGMGANRNFSITWNNDSWMRVGMEFNGEAVNFYYNPTEFVTPPTSAEDSGLTRYDSVLITPTGGKGFAFNTRVLFMAVQFSGNVANSQNHGCDNALLEEWNFPFTPPSFGGPVGGFFTLPDTPYGQYKSATFIHDLFTKARIL